ncbi:MAG: hypothetical protein AVO33_02385 [delta proteobacterium ML8_F1]|nr:MAG: hypothetical protein AVO33_02385 [delta proteobacterium ML8_F1]
MNFLHRYKPYILIAMMDAFATQIYIDLFSNNFRISVAVLLLPVIYYFNRRLNPLIGSVFIGISGVVFRTLVGLPAYDTILESLLADYHILYFDLSYGLFYYFLLYKKKDYQVTTWLLVVIAGDLGSNLIEIFFRIGEGSLLEISDKFYTLFYVALFRTFIALVMVLLIESYKMFLLKSEHNERYQKLLMRISDLESELFFINKNMTQVESVMAGAYDLYENALVMDRSQLKARSLRIASEIHEIKKNYISIYGGIKEITEKDKIIHEVHIQDMMSMLFKSLSKVEEYQEIQMKFQLKNNFVLRDSYYFLTIVRNLVVNGLEELQQPAYRARGRIEMTEDNSDTHYVYRICDNGPGIAPEEIGDIFLAGYSTKFNRESGQSNRGLGLFIVRELTRKIYKGEIDVQSEPGIKTEFIVKIPRTELEVN